MPSEETKEHVRRIAKLLQDSAAIQHAQAKGFLQQGHIDKALMEVRLESQANFVLLLCDSILQGDYDAN